MQVPRFDLAFKLGILERNLWREAHGDAASMLHLSHELTWLALVPRVEAFGMCV